MSDTAGLPKWMEARQTIWRRIQEGTLTPGQRLPPEPELASSLGVSRATLREALRSLAEDGFLRRKPGAGTHIARGPRVATNLNFNYGVADIIRSMGMEPGTQSMKIQLSVADERVSDGLGIKLGASVAVVERVRTADGRPLVFSTSFYPISPDDHSPEELKNLGDESLYTMLERLSGIRIEYGSGSLSVAQADKRLAGHLEIPVGTLLMHLRQIDYDDLGRRVMMSSEYYVGDAFAFTVLRKGTRSHGSQLIAESLESARGGAKSN